MKIPAYFVLVAAAVSAGLTQGAINEHCRPLVTNGLVGLTVGLSLLAVIKLGVNFCHYLERKRN